MLVGASLMGVACGGEPPVSPSCGGGSSFGGFGGQPVFGFTLDMTTLPVTGLGVTVRVGERARVGFAVGPTSVTVGCETVREFSYLGWSWNQLVTGHDATIAQTGPVDVTVVSCRCRLFGDPYWDADLARRGGTPYWRQRAWLDGDQRVELEVLGISPGMTRVNVTAFARLPSYDNGTLIDSSYSSSQSFGVNVIP
jgi:hypothetical protein